MAMPLHRRILIGLGAGVAAGVGAKLFGITETAAWSGAILPALEFVGALFIRLITMIVIPLVVASLLVGVASLGDVGRLGRMGGKTLAYYLLTTAIAVSIGLGLATAVKPGSRIGPETRDALAREFGEEAEARVLAAADKPGVLAIVVDLVPANPVGAAAGGQLLPLIVFVLIFGAAISLTAGESRSTIVSFFQGVSDASMIVIDWVMVLAPFAVFALIAAVIGRFGVDVLRSLAIYALVVAAGLALHGFGTYSVLVATLARRNPLDFFRRIRAAPLIAFSTSSSNATLPVTMETAEEQLGISKPVSSFVLPLGATMNMDGTALYQGVATVFIAQVYGFELGLVALATIVLTATLASVGAAGVPSAGLVTLILVLQSVGLAAQAGAGIALVLGVDRILDMLRTATNVTGDLSCAAFVERSEGGRPPGTRLAAGAGGD
jgi:Na+/H+-dicarboxylate symporter